MKIDKSWYFLIPGFYQFYYDKKQNRIKKQKDRKVSEIKKSTNQKRPGINRKGQIINIEC